MSTTKPKRLKRVFSSADQVLHLWANQSQSDARCKNVFFQGDSVWSYGYHYKLGKLHSVKGKTVALINSERYSATTAKHQSYARQAVNHLFWLESSDVESIDTAIAETQDKLINSLFDVFNQRSFYGGDDLSYFLTEFTVKEVKRFNKICDLIGKKALKIDIPSDYFELVRAHVAQCLEREAASKTPEALEKKRLEREKRETKVREKLAEKIHAWERGGPLVAELRDLSPQLIRANDLYVETTRGAQVPVKDALELFGKLLNGTAKPNEEIGSFRFTSKHGDEVRVGCHVISFEQAKSVLTQRMKSET